MFPETVRAARGLLHACLLLAFTVALAGQNQVPARPAELEPSTLEARLTATKEASGLSDADRAAATASYLRAMDLVRTGDAAAEAKRQMALAKESEAARLSEARAELAKPQSTATPTAANDSSLAELERAALAAEEIAKVANTELRTAEANQQLRSQRQPLLPQLIATARDKLASLTTQLDAQGSDPTLAEPAMAQRIALTAEHYAMAQEVAKLEAELASYSGSEELLVVLRDLAARRANRADDVARAWQAIVASRRTQEAKLADQSPPDVAATAARQDRHPKLLQIAEASKLLAVERTAIAEDLIKTTASLSATEERLSALDADLKDVSQRIKSVGLTDAMGALLRDRRASLPVPRKIRQRIDQRNQRRSAVQVRRYELKDQRLTWIDPDYLPTQLATAEPPIPAGSSLAGEAAALISARITNLEAVLSDSGKLFDALVRLDGADQLLLAKSLEYTEFVSERVLWVRSTTPIWAPQIAEAANASAFLLSPSNWLDVQEALASDFAANASPLILAALLVLGMALMQGRVQRGIQTLGSIAIKSSTVTFAPTAWVLLLTILASLPLPTCSWLLGWRLDLAAGSSDFAKSIGQALMLCTWPLLALGFFRQVVRPEGLAESHFQWSDYSLRIYRNNLRWLTPTVIVCSLVLATLEYLGNLEWKGALGRPVLLLMLGALAFFFRHILHPRTGVRDRAATITTGWSKRAGYVFYLLGSIVPLALLLLDALGYHFTALQLLLRLAAMTALVSGLFLTHDTVLRGLVLARRKLAIAQAAERRKAAAATKADAGESAKIAAPIDDPMIDVSSVAEQTRSLIRSLLTLCIAIGTWAVWIDVLPALGIFRTVVLWGEKPEAITLADAILATIVFVMTFLAARNIPGVLQLTLLHRWKVHAGEGHAITTIARYLILLIGTLYGFSTLGLGWGRLQWLAAGISVGLGFGLQEIFANFISGLIILFERPIRVGDLVTVRDVDGYVTRIRMRATTIRDYNRKELIIPNKEFVTGSVVNWTLTDSVARIIIRVGIAYGSDVNLARTLLLEIGRAERTTLTSPKPKALFRSFGDSTLDFELRVFIADVDDSPEVIDRLHTEIDARFRAAKIEIAFPQRDLHLRTASGLSELLQQTQRPSSVTAHAADPADAETATDRND